MRKVLRRIMGGEQGYSLIELLVTMVILSVVLGSLTTVFLSGTTAEASLNRRFQAQQSARAGLDKIRGDIHCATAAQAKTINTFPGLRLTVANCYPSTPTISWCVVQATAAPPRYKLYRSTTTGATTCGSSDAARLLVADYLTSSAAFATATIQQYTLQRAGIDFKVSADAKAGVADTYELTDLITVRNATRCVTAGGCAAPVVP